MSRYGVGVSRFGVEVSRLGVEVSSFGRSYEGRDIPLVTLSK